MDAPYTIVTEVTPAGSFVQEAGQRMLDLFTPVVSEDKLHPNFVRVAITARPEVKAVLQGWTDGFVDRDNKFVIEFQTTFNSAFWELYLFAAFKELRLDPDLSHHAPDFLLRGAKPESIAEAVVTSHAAGHRPEWDWVLGRPMDAEELVRTASIRLSNSITSKHTKYVDEYAKLRHVAGKPFMVCVAPFDQPGAYRQNLSAIRLVLLGYDVPITLGQGDERVQVGESLLEVLDKDSGALVPVGLFRTSAFKEVSAVLFSNCATWGKLDALASVDEPDMIFAVQRLRSGSLEPSIKMLHKSEHQEGLLDGLHLFPNPFALHAIDPTPFRTGDAAIHHFNPATGEYEPEMKEGMLLQRTVRRIIPHELAEQAVARAPSGVRTYKEPTRPQWREGELRRTGSRAGPFVDVQLAHYRGWTALVGLDVSDDSEDWLGHVKKGLFYTVAAFTHHRTDDEFTLDGSYMSAGAAASAAFTRIDLIEAGLDEL